MKAIIVGGGAGGLAAALALDRIGWETCVIERSARVDTAGFGLQIGPNGTRILKYLGVTPAALQETAFHPEHLELRDGLSGNIIARLPLRRVAKQVWKAPFIQLRRCDLLAAMRDELERRQPRALRFGAAVLNVTDSGTGVCATCADGSAIEGDLLVGADGIRSRVREHLFGLLEPEFTGRAVWRAIVPAADLHGQVPPSSACVWTGAGRHAVTTRVCGGSHINFVGMVEKHDWQHVSSWHVRGNSAEVLDAFAAWNAAPRAVIRAAGTLDLWGLFLPASLPCWSRGRIVVVGDAAHPMMPSLAQGAVQAIEDAFVLARLLEQGCKPKQVGERLFAARRHRVQRVQHQSALNVQRFHARNPVHRAVLDMTLGIAARMVPAMALRRLDWLYGAKGVMARGRAPAPATGQF